MKSPIQHQFAQIPSANIQRSIFNRTHGHKTTFNAGDIVPILWDLALPGDSFRVNMTAFARLVSPFNRGSGSDWSNVGGFAGNSSDRITMSAQPASGFLVNILS